MELTEPYVLHEFEQYINSLPNTNLTTDMLVTSNDVDKLTRMLMSKDFRKEKLRKAQMRARLYKGFSTDVTNRK